MKTITNFINKHAVLAYFILTLIFTWGCMWIAASPGGFPLTDEQLETSGALVYVAMLVGPSGAGFLLIGMLDGRDGFRKLRARLLKWKVNPRWYAIAILTAPIVITSILIGLSQISDEFQPVVFTSDNNHALILSSIAMGLSSSPPSEDILEGGDPHEVARRSMAAVRHQTVIRFIFFFKMWTSLPRPFSSIS